MDKFLYWVNQNPSLFFIIWGIIGLILLVLFAVAVFKENVALFNGIIIASLLVVAVAFSVGIASDVKVSSDFDKLTQRKTYKVIKYRDQKLRENGGRHASYYLIKTKGHGIKVVPLDKYDFPVDKQDKFADKKHKPGTTSITYTETTYSKKLPKYQREAFENSLRKDSVLYFELKVINYKSDKA